MKLNELGMPQGRQKKKIRKLGRGNGSGRGGTAGRGHKGQKARSGGYHKVGFEGGQMPLQRRLPKRGFTNKFRKRLASINLDQLSNWPSGTDVTKETLREQGIVKKAPHGVKLLGRGELKGVVNFKIAAVSESARKKVEAAGGKIEVVRG